MQDSQNASLKALEGCVVVSASLESIESFAAPFPLLVLKNLAGKTFKVTVLSDDDFNAPGYLEIQEA